MHQTKFFWRAFAWLVGCVTIVSIANPSQGQQPDGRQSDPPTSQRQEEVGGEGAPQRGSVAFDGDVDINQILEMLPPEAINGLIGADIEVEVVGDQIFLRGPEEAVKALELIIVGLEEQRKSEQKVLEVITVEKRDANEIASAIEPVLQELLTKPNQRSEDQVTVRALSPRKILAAALPGDIDFVVSVIRSVDEEEQIADFEQLVFPVQYRKAAEVATQLQDMLRRINEQRGASGAQAEIQVTPNNANNTIIVIAPETEREKIQRLIDSIDVEPSTGWSNVKLTLFPLRHSKAEELSGVIENLLTQPTGQEAAEEVIFRLQISKALADGSIVELSPIDLQKPTRIIPDEGTNSLIVATVEENVGPMQELIGLLDGVPSSEELDVHLYPLRFADAESVREKLQQLFDSGKELPPDPDGSGENSVPEGEASGLVYNVTLEADVRTNTLIFAGRPEQRQLVERIVDELDRPATALKFPLQLIRLDYADATRVAQIITELFDQRFAALEATNSGSAALERERVFLSTDIRTNALIVSASEENFDEITRIVSELDSKPARLFDQIHIVNCERVDATDVKTQIDELWQRKAALRSAEEQLEDLPVVVVDERSNALVVASSKEDYEEIQKLVAALEAQPLVEDTKLFDLNYADPRVLAEMLDQLFEGMASQSEAFTAPTILPDSRSNALIVAAGRDTMERVTDLIKRMDVEPGPMAAVFRVYPLEFGSATKLAARMQELFDSRSEGEDMPRTPIVILPDEGSNSLVTSASRDDHEAIRELLEMLDQPSSIARQFQIFPLRRAKSGVIAEKLTTLFQSQAESGGGDGAAATAIEADERTNSLIVWASPTEMENIEQVIERLDTSTPVNEMTVRIIQLRRALAEDFATFLRDGLIGEQGGEDDEKARILSYTVTNPDGTEETRKLLKQDITITPDPRTNSIMVVAPSESMAMLESMLRDFDRVKPVQNEVRLFPLINADAESMVEQLTEIFNPETQEGETQAQMNFGLADDTSEFPQVGQELRFTADTRTNTVIATGAEVELRMVEELVRYLDAQEIEERMVDVYETKFLRASEIADAVDSFFQKEQDVAGLTDDEQSALRQMERQVSIQSIGDDEEGGGSNRLIVGTSRRTYQQVMRMIQALDRPEPQVMISVLIAEVSLLNDVELGMEIAGQDLSFSENAILGPNGIVQGNQFDYVLGTTLGTPADLGVNFTVTGEDFSFLFHALQRDARIETLSRPILMVRNGEEGVITIADQVPIITSSQITDTGGISTGTGREDVGVVMTATPSISPDGYVTLALRQELSNIGNNVTLTEGVTQPIFNTREIETNITVRDGETVIIGGLITSQEDQSETKVPILGDLPVIGPAFRSTLASKEKTELLVVLTVDILWTDEDLQRMSIEQRDKFVLPDSIRTHPLMEGLRIRPEESGMGPQREGDAGTDEPIEVEPTPQERKIYGPKPKIYGPSIPDRSTKRVEARPIDSTNLPTMAPEPRPAARSSWHEPMSQPARKPEDTMISTNSMRATDPKNKPQPKPARESVPTMTLIDE